MEAPQVKARFVNDNIDSLDVLDAAQVVRVHEKLVAMRSKLEEVSASGWVPVEWDLELQRAIFSVAGRAGVRAVSRQGLVKSLSSPLLKPIIQGGISLFGLRPTMFLKLLARGWAAGTRNLGTVHVEDAGETEATIVLEHLPPVVQDLVWHESNAGMFEGFFIASKVSGVVETPSFSGDHASYSIRWGTREA